MFQICVEGSTQEYSLPRVTTGCWCIVIIPAPFMWMHSWFVVTKSLCGWECKEKVDKVVKSSPRQKHQLLKDKDSIL